MSDQELIALIDELVAGPDELEWLEFKDSFFEPLLLGEYLSALANGACLSGKPKGYLLFGTKPTCEIVVGGADGSQDPGQ